jgi:hypothetical protein
VSPSTVIMHPAWRGGATSTSNAGIVLDIPK